MILKIIKYLLIISEKRIINIEPTNSSNLLKGLLGGSVEFEHIEGGSDFTKIAKYNILVLYSTYI